ncbi:hypothetical protein FEDK69T_25750 [Flavobacterium enshiense DK69]|nr:hypothetical protein FEDK69T_25750 [Flavobacterium enshiense DK69]
MLALSIVFSIVFSIYWHYKEKSNSFNSEKCHVWLTTLLRYWLAVQIATFGFEKILGVNFAHSYHADDALTSTLNGQELTWIYYSYSYGLSLIVAFFQIVGSYLLLFRRTILIGVSLLLPVMFNIVLINLFYGIGIVVAFTAISMTLGLIYLLYQRKEEIISFFKRYEIGLPTIGNSTIRNSIRVVCILLPIFFITYYKSNVYASSKYFGKWEVETMKRNGSVIPEKAWEKDTLAWKNIYFEERGKLYCTPNPYKYDDDVSILFKYEYNEDKDAIRVISYEKNPQQPDTIPVQINKFKGNSMEWNMVFYKDTIQMQLKREN